MPSSWPDAAIGYEDAGWRPGPEHRPVDMLEEAVTALGEHPTELRVQLLAGLSRALDMQGEHDRASIVRTNAIELARALDDRAGLASLLVRSYWSRGSTPLEQIVDMLAEARVLGQQLGNPEIEAEAISWIVPAYVAMADIPPARAATAELREMARITGQPFYSHVAAHYGAALALSEGRLDVADAMARRSQEAGRMLTGRDASGTYGIQMFSIRREQGRLAELAPVIRILCRGEPAAGSVAARARLPAGRARDGGRGPPRARPHPRRGPRAVSRALARVAHVPDRRVRRSCETRRSRPSSMPNLSTPDRHERDDRTSRRLLWRGGPLPRDAGGDPGRMGTRRATTSSTAIALNRKMEMRTWLAQTEYEYARMLLAQGPAERDRAASHLSRAAELAADIGMSALSSRVAALGAPVAPAALPDDLSGREAEVLRLVARGLSNREIGSALFISEHTAANHIRSILRKTGCANRTEAASYAHRHGLAATESRG